MKPPRLSRAQWELLRKLPDAGTRSGGLPLGGGEKNSARSLRGKGLARIFEASGYFEGWRTSDGLALIEAEDERIAEEKRHRASLGTEPIYCPACQKYHPTITPSDH